MTDDVRLVGSPERPAGVEPASIPPPDPREVQRALQAVWEGSVPGVAPPSGDLDAVVAELGRRLAVRFGA